VLLKFETILLSWKFDVVLDGLETVCGSTVGIEAKVKFQGKNTRKRLSIHGIA